jgi:hypothetical protein
MNWDIELSQTFVIVAMASNFNLDDVENLQAKIDRKAPNLFKKRAGEAPLHVNRILFDISEKNEKGRCVRNQAIESLSELEELRKVAIPSNPTQNGDKLNRGKRSDKLLILFYCRAE